MKDRPRRTCLRSRSSLARRPFTATRARPSILREVYFHLSVSFYQRDIFRTRYILTDHRRVPRRTLSLLSPTPVRRCSTLISATPLSPLIPLFRVLLAKRRERTGGESARIGYRRGAARRACHSINHSDMGIKFRRRVDSRRAPLYSRKRGAAVTFLFLPLYFFFKSRALFPRASLSDRAPRLRPSATEIFESLARTCPAH